MARKQKLDVESSSYYKPEPFPLELDEFSIEAKTKSGLDVRIASQKDVTIRRFDKVKNPNLILLLDFHGGKVYMKKDDGSLWLFAYNEKQMVWIRLYDYIIEGLKALSILYDRDFISLIPKNIWITRNVKKKMMKLLKILENEGILKEKSDPHRTSIEKNVVLPNSIREKKSSEKVFSGG
jgi:hypothetical protein